MMDKEKRNYYDVDDQFMIALGARILSVEEKLFEAIIADDDNENRRRRTDLEEHFERLTGLYVNILNATYENDDRLTDAI